MKKFVNGKVDQNIPFVTKIPKSAILPTRNSSKMLVFMNRIFDGTKSLSNDSFSQLNQKLSLRSLSQYFYVL